MRLLLSLDVEGGTRWLLVSDFLDAWFLKGTEAHAYYLKAPPLFILSVINSNSVSFSIL